MPAQSPAPGTLLIGQDRGAFGGARVGQRQREVVGRSDIAVVVQRGEFAEPAVRGFDGVGQVARKLIRIIRGPAAALGVDLEADDRRPAPNA